MNRSNSGRSDFETLENHFPIQLTQYHVIFYLYFLQMLTAWSVFISFQSVELKPTTDN